MRSTFTTTTTLGAALLLPSLAFSQSSGCGPAPSNGIRPSIASGYTYQVVATGLSRPRGIHIDTEGNLLVVERGKGAVTAHTLEEENGCVSIASSTDVTGDIDVCFPAFGARPLHILTSSLAQPWHRTVSRWDHPLCVQFRRHVLLDL